MKIHAINIKFAMSCLVVLLAVLPVLVLAGYGHGVNNNVYSDRSVVEVDFSRIGLKVDASSQFIDKKVNATGCSCIGYNCGCCETLDIPQIDLNETGCVNITYLPAPEYGMSVTLTINKFVFLNKTVSARNPPLLCVGVPHLKQYAELCVKFYNLSLTTSNFAGCVEVLAKLKYVLVEKIDIGCFKIPFPSDTKQYLDMYRILKMKAAFLTKNELLLKNLQLNP